MVSCSKIHEQYDQYANSEVQVGQLPMWMHVSGKVAWYVFQGPYSNMTLAWAEFMKKVQNSKVGEIVGPPGDVYVCDPQEHKGNEQKLTTILWTPLKE